MQLTLVLFVSFLAVRSAHSAESTLQMAAGKPSLCSLLEKIENGEQISAVVSGIYYRGYEMQVLYDPDRPECDFDVQPSTWVEFSAGVRSAVLENILQNDDRAYVTFKGTLVGPDKKPGPDDPSLPPLMSTLSRRSHRYGHLNAFRTKLVVSEVIEAHPVPVSVPYRSDNTKSATAPEVQRAEIPHYPSIARQLGISGDVEVEVQVRSGKVTATEVMSGDRLLSVYTLANIQTWDFSPDTTTSFVTRFEYVLEKPPKKGNRNPKVDLELPFLVKVTASFYAW